MGALKMEPFVRNTEDVTSEAYHGTKETVAQEIRVNGFLLPTVDSREARYGRGVYFWMNSKDQAVWWAKKLAQRGETIAVIRAKVAFGKHLSLVSWDGQKLILKIAKQLSGTKSGTITEAAVLNFMATRGWIDSVLILDYPEKAPQQLFTGSHSVAGPRLILCVYKVEKILERTIILTEAA